MDVLLAKIVILVYNFVPKIVKDKPFLKSIAIIDVKVISPKMFS